MDEFLDTCHHASCDERYMLDPEGLHWIGWSLTCPHLVDDTPLTSRLKLGMPEVQRHYTLDVN